MYDLHAIDLSAASDRIRSGGHERHTSLEDDAADVARLIIVPESMYISSEVISSVLVSILARTSLVRARSGLNSIMIDECDNYFAVHSFDWNSSHVYECSYK